MSLRRSILRRKSWRSWQQGEIEVENGVFSSSGALSLSRRPQTEAEAVAEADGWANVLPELLVEIIKRLEASEDRWPQRQSVVACACVCKKWRRVTKDFLLNSSSSACSISHQITFPSCLKQPGPRDFSHQCLIKRNKKTSSFYLYLALSPSFADREKFLLAARRYRRGAHSEYIISLDVNGLSQGSNAYVGKLRWNHYTWKEKSGVMAFLPRQLIITSSRPM